VGRQSTPYKVAGVRLDPFFDASTLSVVGGLPVGPSAASASFGLSRMTNGWADRGVIYRSPTLAGVSASAAGFLGAEGGQDWGLGLLYEEGSVRAGAEFHRDGSGGGSWAASAGVDRALRVHALLLARRARGHGTTPGAFLRTPGGVRLGPGASPLSLSCPTPPGASAARPPLGPQIRRAG